MTKSNTVNKQVISSQSRCWAALLLGVSLILLIWLVVLPRIAQIEAVSQRMQFFEARGIDPSARYYTDQPAGWRNAGVMEHKMRQTPEAFWRVGQ